MTMKMIGIHTLGKHSLREWLEQWVKTWNAKCPKGYGAKRWNRAGRTGAGPAAGVLNTCESVPIFEARAASASVLESLTAIRINMAKTLASL